MNELIILFFFIAFLSFIFGVVYPAGMILYYKVYKHSKKSIAQILEEL